VYCCDVLEHVSDLDRVISETARLLKPGGLYLFDTVNRTLQSKLVAIKIAQEWPLTRVVDTPMHDWQMFIKPAELTRTLHRHGLHLGEIAGLGPRAKMPTVLRSFISASKGRITYGERSREHDPPGRCFALRADSAADATVVQWTNAGRYWSTSSIATRSAMPSRRSITAMATTVPIPVCASGWR
jgi:SAM-dependent methyltransferase